MACKGMNRRRETMTAQLLHIIVGLFAMNALALNSTASSSSSSSLHVLQKRSANENILDHQSLLSKPASSASDDSSSSISSTLEDLLYALNVMQDDYFELWQATWPTSIDWTAAVLGTQVSAALSTLTSTPNAVLASILSSSPSSSSSRDDGTEKKQQQPALTMSKHAAIAFENIMDHFFEQVSVFYFGENSIGLRNQAYDDMLWVVLGWLENVKLQELHTDLRYGVSGQSQRPWHGTQFRGPAAHRARVFYDLASAGYDRSLCGGGMIWSPHLAPYKNAITNQLYIAASVGMYLYFPGDPIDSPFYETTTSPSSSHPDEHPHNPEHLNAAIEAYNWLKNSHMTGLHGLYGDGFHIQGYTSPRNPGTSNCDVLDPMLHSYNQGVILSALRGLWLSTASPTYLADGHDLVRRVMTATGWPDTTSSDWSGLGRAGIMEDTCDSHGSCSQDGQVFKGIFFLHLAEFCRPLRPQESRFLVASSVSPVRGASSASAAGDYDDDWQATFTWHQDECRTYRSWIEHNADAALTSRDENGKFGMWWGWPYLRHLSGSGSSNSIVNSSYLPPGVVDRVNDNDSSGAEAGMGMGYPRSDRVRELRSRPFSAGSAGISQGRGQRRPHMRVRDDCNDRGRGRTVETQSGGVAVLRALLQWKIAD